MTSLSTLPALDRGGSDPMPDDVFREIAAIAHRNAGLMIPDTKRTLVQSRIARRMRALGLSGFREYLDLVRDGSAGGERRHMISALTTNVSSFFREAHHFDRLREELAPAWLKTARVGGRIRIWSAGCSTGQEPYSIAITLLEVTPEFAAHDVRILATDIDPIVLETARAGEYDMEGLAGLSEEQISRFFANCDVIGGTCRIDPEVQALVRFRELNLLEPWPMRGQFDAIFCRNVVIYFDGRTQAALWPRFRDALCPAGRLFLGHSERVADPASCGLIGDGVTAYRNRDYA